eukprot:contig_7251_g1692
MSGEVSIEEGDSVGEARGRTAYDYFITMFPMDQLTRMVRLTSTKLEAWALRLTTRGELLKPIGVIIPATRYEFGVGDQAAQPCIGVEESMCKWYGHGGSWIKRGLPMYVKIHQKPEKGCEVQHAACERSGIMLRLSLMTSSDHQKATADADEADVPHGKVVLKRLVWPWGGTQRVVFADTYFACAPAAVHLRAMGFGFTACIKTATRGFPMQALSTLELGTREEHATYTHKTLGGAVGLMTVMWVDRERRYFILSTSTTLPGDPHERLRYRQIYCKAERLPLTLRLPRVVQEYYECCAMIDRHNRCRQDDLRLEHKLGTHNWSTRVNMSLLSMSEVDAWMLYCGARGSTVFLTQRQIYEDSAAQLIDNTFDTMGIRARGTTTGTPAADTTAPLRYGVGINRTPNLKRRGLSAAEEDLRAQCRCRVCKRFKSSLVCSGCRGPGLE